MAAAELGAACHLKAWLEVAQLQQWRQAEAHAAVTVALAAARQADGAAHARGLAGLQEQVGSL